jgi:hypothetical protein
LRNDLKSHWRDWQAKDAYDTYQLDNHPIELLIEILARPLTARYMTHVRLGGNTPDEDLDEIVRLRREVIRGKTES